MTDEAPQATPERVLVVEDNEHASYLMRSLLERVGFVVTVSRDGRDAIAKLESIEPVDLVLLDLMLPYVSGYQVLIEARKNTKWRNVPIIVVTARTLEMDAVRALETGANDFVRKPFRPDELVARVRRAIEIFRADLMRTLKLLGCGSVRDLDASYIEHASGRALRAKR